MHHSGGSAEIGTCQIWLKLGFSANFDCFDKEKSHEMSSAELAAMEERAKSLAGRIHFWRPAASRSMPLLPLAKRHWRAQPQKPAEPAVAVQLAGGGQVYAWLCYSLLQFLHCALLFCAPFELPVLAQELLYWCCQAVISFEESPELHK